MSLQAQMQLAAYSRVGLLDMTLWRSALQHLQVVCELAM